LQDNSRNLIGHKFEELREKGESALIAYLTANDPSPEAFRANCNALVEGGADILVLEVVARGLRVPVEHCYPASVPDPLNGS